MRPSPQACEWGLHRIENFPREGPGARGGAAMAAWPDRWACADDQDVSLWIVRGFKRACTMTDCLSEFTAH